MLVPVRASPVPSVVRGSFVVKFFSPCRLLRIPAPSRIDRGSVPTDSRQNALPTYLSPGRAAKRKKMKIGGTYLLQGPFGRNKTNLPNYLGAAPSQTRPKTGTQDGTGCGFGRRRWRRRPLHPRLPSRAPSRRARPILLVHGTRRHTAAENRRCCARSARDLVLLRLDPAIPRVYL